MTSKTRYTCKYCGHDWLGSQYALLEPECSKCGSKGQYYIITKKAGKRVDYYEDDPAIEITRKVTSDFTD